MEHSEIQLAADSLQQIAELKAKARILPQTSADKRRRESIDEVIIAQRYTVEPLPLRMSELILIVSDSTVPPMSTIGTSCAGLERSLQEHIYSLSQD